MKLFEALKKRYSRDSMRAQEAQELAHIYSFGPMVFQVARLMIKYGIFEYLGENKEGCTAAEVEQKTGLSAYAVKCLLESALTMRCITINPDTNRYQLAKVGWFLQNDAMIRADIDFNHDVNYEGLFLLDKALEEGAPAGLKHFGDWPTIYEGLSSLPAEVQRSWFGFDHYYSDHSFDEALAILRAQDTRYLLDVGGNTGRFALRCVEANPDLHVTICDLPQQLEMMRRYTADHPGADRIDGVGMNLLDPEAAFPTDKHYDVIWMSQFLDCFGEEQIISILRRAAQLLDGSNRIYVMETLWDRQKYPAAAFCLTQTSLYFTAMANGTSKMYNTDDMERMVLAAGLQIETIHDGLGQGGHSILVIK